MRWRTVGRIAVAVVVGLVVAGAVAAVGIAGAAGEIYTPRDGSAPPAPVDEVAAPPHDPGKPTAVIMLGPEVANAADVLAPYEVLAASGAFNLYTVAPAGWTWFPTSASPSWTSGCPPAPRWWWCRS